MSETTTPTDRSKVLVWAVGALGTFLIVGGLVWVLDRYTRPEPIAALRAVERQKFLQEVRAAEAKGLNEFSWQDKGKGVVRLPISRAMELTLREWLYPAAARSNLVERVTKATAVAPPPANPYE
jgi:hypothetical protein